MRLGGNALLSTAVLATAACVSDSGKLAIRPLADPYTKATKAGSPTVAEARGLLAVGSVGLAIEGFRKALREDPNSIEALAGLAECYDQMGRHDLSQAKYEAALAIAPTNPTLLRTFAASLERQGRFAEAKELRGEAAAADNVQAVPPVRTAAPAPTQVQAQAAPIKVAVAQPPMIETSRGTVPYTPIPLQMTSTPLVSRTSWAVDVAPIAPPPEVAATSVTVKLPPAAPGLAERPKISTSAPPRVEAPKVTASVEPPKVAAAASQPVEPSKVAPVAPPAAQPAKVAVAVAPSVTMKLPLARPVAASSSQTPVGPEIRQIVEAAPLKVGPRLERLSLGEVALLTDPRPRWRSEASQVAIGTRPRSASLREVALVPDPRPRWRNEARQVAIGAAPRFVPLAQLQGNYGLRLLNAARHEGLAARTRLALHQQGWKSVTIGDSARIRQRSLVLYSEKTEKAARRLAAQFGFWIAKEARPGPLTILLGRDWATRSQSRA
jgi:hypothetical protein